MSGDGMFGGVPVSELDADLVPAAGGGLRLEGRVPCGLVQLHGVGEVCRVREDAGGGLAERCACQDGQDRLLRRLRRGARFHVLASPSWWLARRRLLS